MLSRTSHFSFDASISITDMLSTNNARTFQLLKMIFQIVAVIIKITLENHMWCDILSGLPPSGKIREIFDLLESQGISIFFAESQGKVHRKSQGKSGNSNQADWWQPCFMKTG